MRLGVVGHRGYAGLGEALRLVASLGPELGFDVAYERELWTDDDGEDTLDGRELTDASEIDALLTLGGDGTLLRGARFLAGRQAPILGVNFGRLGFLTSCGADEMEPALRALAAGEYTAEARMALEARALDGDRQERRRWFALNDVVLHKGGFARGCESPPTGTRSPPTPRMASWSRRRPGRPRTASRREGPWSCPPWSPSC